MALCKYESVQIGEDLKSTNRRDYNEEEEHEREEPLPIAESLGTDMSEEVQHCSAINLDQAENSSHEELIDVDQVKPEIENQGADNSPISNGTYQQG